MLIATDFVGSHPLIALSHHKDITITPYRDSDEKDSVFINGMENAAAMDFSFEGSLIFWADTVLKRIMSANFNGSAVKNVISHGLVRPCE